MALNTLQTKMKYLPVNHLVATVQGVFKLIINDHFMVYFGFSRFVTSRDTYLSAKALEHILGLPETPTSIWNRE